ncbi:MAG: hypothetical protein ACXV4A_01190 [Actinomycetes bacterium]
MAADVGGEKVRKMPGYWDVNRCAWVQSDTSSAASAAGTAAGAGESAGPVAVPDPRAEPAEPGVTA